MNTADGNQSNGRITLILMVGLLVLRIFFLNFFFFYRYTIWVEFFYVIGTYALFAVLIYREREKLLDFHLDGPSLFLIISLPIFLGVSSILALFLQELEPNVQLGSLSAVFNGCAATALYLGVRKQVRMPDIRSKHVVWCVAGILAGIIFAGLEAYFKGAQLKVGGEASIFSYFLVALSVNFFQASIFEEPLFRGFLWGYLFKLVKDEKKVLLLQMLLFWVAHIKYIGAPATFWISVPLSGLLLGLLVWRSRSLTTSMFAHAAMNAVVYLFNPS